MLCSNSFHALCSAATYNSRAVRGNALCLFPFSALTLLTGGDTHLQCLQCFDAVGWAAGRASGLYKTEWWGAGELMPPPLTVSCFSKIQIGLTFLVQAFW